MRFKKTLYSFGLLLVTTLAAAQDQEQNQESSNSANPLSGLNSFLKGVSNSINSAAAQIQSGAKTGNQADNVETATRRRLSDTGLKGIFNSASSMEWPRLAVTINKLPKWFYYMPPSGMPGRYSPSDCINISITAWQNNKMSKAYDNLDFCGDDIISETPFSDVGVTWKNLGIASTTSNTGGMRTRGPLPPQRLFPNKPGLDMFFHMNGSYYIGSIMATLGYNWKEPQDFRFWIVNLPTQAESVRGVSVSMAPQSNPSTDTNRDETSKTDAASINQTVTTKCTAQNFTAAHFNKIAVGMTVEQVNSVIGCQFDPDFTQTSANTKMYAWAASRGSLVGAYMIRVFFDSTGTKVKGLGNTFKTSEGF